MQERIDRQPFDPETFVEHLRRAADAIEAPVAESRTRRLLALYDSELRSCVVQLKATDRPGSGVYYRFFYNGPLDLTARAQEAGLLPSDGSPIIELQREILGTFDGATRAGLDFDSGFGLAKVWTYTGGPIPVDRIYALGSLPESVRAHARFFERFGLRDVYFTASDHQGDSMNVYFGWDPACRNAAWIRQMLSETGSEPVPDVILDEILRSQAVAGGVGCTFYWNRPGLGRWCLYSLEIPYASGAPAWVCRPRLPNRLARFRDLTPTLNQEPQFNVAWSFGRAGTYVKLEKSYARDATFFLTHEMGGDLSHPEPTPETASRR